jgi:hypothetical protein
MTDICIIGAGAAGLLLLHFFENCGILPERITIIDPYFDGGALFRDWGFVTSNTKWEKTVEAIHLLNPKVLLSETVNETTPLHKIAKFLTSTIHPYFEKTNVICGCVKKTRLREGKWYIHLQSGETIQTKIVFFCTGAKQKTLDLPIPTVSLGKALHFPSVSSIVEKKDTVLVFGTMHSGCLVLQNLHSIGCSVKAVYKGEKPFVFARDNKYDGIKEDAEKIADSILQGEYKTTELISFYDFQKVGAAIRKADWCIYCMGFEIDQSYEIQNEEGVGFLLSSYDPITGKLPLRNAWAFGIACPNRAPDGIHYDVSVLSFANHIHNQKADILSAVLQ